MEEKHIQKNHMDLIPYKICENWYENKNIIQVTSKILGKFYLVNLSKEVWTLIDSVHTVKEIIAQIGSEHETTALREFDTLVKNGIIGFRKSTNNLWGEEDEYDE